MRRPDFQRIDDGRSGGRLAGRLALVMALVLLAPAARPAPRAPLYATPDFSAAGLNLETELTALYLGDFEHARLRNNSLEFLVLVNSFIGAYDSRCREQLPADKVEQTRSECAREQYRVNGYGVRVGPSTCIEYRQVPTGVFAHPAVDAARRNVEDAVVPAATGAIMRNPMGTVGQTMDANASVGNDLVGLVDKNACTSPGLVRFQDNLVRFAMGQPALRLPSGATLQSTRVGAAPGTATGAAFKDSNYARLLDDLIAENSQAWVMNRYVAGGISRVSVLGRDGKGRPAALYAFYAFNGPSGRAQSGVKLVFVDGLPSCLYFDDMPGTCRSASRRIVTDYESGRYQN